MNHDLLSSTNIRKRRHENKEQIAVALYTDPLLLILMQHYRRTLLDRENDVVFGESARNRKARKQIQLQRTLHICREFVKQTIF